MSGTTIGILFTFLTALAILFTTTATAIDYSNSELQITEVELNPSGPDSGNEWFELFSSSNEEISLLDYTLKNNDGDTLDLDGKIFSNSHYLVELEKQWLDNSDESISIIKKESNQIIFQTPILEDSSNDNKTWNYCPNNNEQWTFTEPSRGSKPDCDSQSSNTNEGDNTELTIPNDDNLDESSDNNEMINNIQVTDNSISQNNPPSSSSETPDDNSPIILTTEKLSSNSLNNNNKNNKESSIVITSSQSFRTGITIAFTLFLVIIIIFLSLNKL